MSVLHTEWSDGWGGQEIRIINEMLAIREQGIEVYLACRKFSCIKKKAEEHNIKVFILPFKGNTDLTTIYLLRKIIKNNNIDIVNTHSGKDTWVGGFAAKLAGVKFIRTRHLSNPIRSSRLNFINEIADYILTTGETVRSDMIKYNRINPDKIKSIPTGIDCSVFDPEKFDRLTCRQKFNIQENEIVIGMVAVLRQFKRHDIFLEIAKTLIAQFPQKNIRFFIAGDGPQKNSIVQQIDFLGLQNHVELLGHTDNVPEFLAAIDIFVLTSDSKEGVPQSVIQALMMNKPTVATNVGSTKDLFKNNFLLVEPLRDAILKGLTTLMTDETKRNKLSITARPSIVTIFSLSHMTNSLISVYNKLLDSATP